ncbi:hypothetical protein Ancab_003515 [Ancistrocladus abbreviatus]
MASIKLCFILYFILALSTSSIDMSLAARHLLQTMPPISSLPLPKPNLSLPPLPATPKLPQTTLPPLPYLPTASSLPKPNLPPLPATPLPTTPAATTLPKPSLPPLPAVPLL